MLQFLIRVVVKQRQGSCGLVLAMRGLGGRADPPGVVYVYAPCSKGELPMAHPQGSVGVLQDDGYSGYRTIGTDSSVSLAFCWSHAHWSFYVLAAAGRAPEKPETG